MRFALPLLAIAAISAPAFAQDAHAHHEGQAQQEAAPAKAEVPVIEKQVCKNIRTDMSSRRTERLCMTKKEWSDYERRSRR